MRIRRTLAPVGYRLPLTTLAPAAVRGLVMRGDANRVLTSFMKEHGVSTAFGVSSGKAALTVILQALGALSPRRKVIIPGYTCYSVPSAIVKAGLDVVPCDIAADSFDYDYDQLMPMLGPDVLGVLSVDLFGIPDRKSVV